MGDKEALQRSAMMFIAFAMTLILSFPTLASAMSGYDSNLNSFIPVQDRGLVPFPDFKFAWFRIQDGSRISNISSDMPGNLNEGGRFSESNYDQTSLQLLVEWKANLV